MPVHLYVHASWTTFARLPLVTAPVAEFLHRFLPTEATRHGARSIAVGVLGDHVHLVLELPPVIDVPRLMQGLKGASARIANRDGISGHESLRWAKGYDLRSVGPRQLEAAVAYVRGQAARHPDKAVECRSPVG